MVRLLEKVLEKLYSDESVVPPIMRWKYVEVREYEAVYKRSIGDVAGFWGEEAKKLVWAKPWRSVIEGIPPHVMWFVGGEISAYHNVVERHRGTWVWNKPAIIWESEQGDAEAISYESLHNLVEKLSSALKSIGIGAGDWVIFYVPPTIESIALMLASIRIGAPFEAVFTGFGFYELGNRIASRRPRLLVTTDGFYRRGRVIDTISTVRRAIEYAKHRCSTVVIERIGSVKLMESEISFDSLKSLGRERVDSFVGPSDHPLFGLHIAYEDGYKPITHGVGGYLVQTYSTSRWIGLRPHDTYFCTVWPGWITGITYVVFGPLMIGSTIVLYEGSFDYPSIDRWWDIIERYAVTLFLTTGSALRMLSRAGDQHLKAHNMDTLRAILVTAEPLEKDVWWWTYRVVGTGGTAMITSVPGSLSGRIPVLNMYIQSELATFVLGNLINYTFTPVVPGSVGRPIPGFDIDVVDEHGNSVRDSIGELVLRKPWPSMPVEAPKEFFDSWREGFYRTGDYAYMKKDFTVFVLGRRDGVMKVSGYRLSPGAVENILREKLGKNVIVVGMPDEARFEAPMIISKEGLDLKTVRNLVREYVGAISEPIGIKVMDFDEKAPKSALRLDIKKVFWS